MKQFKFECDYVEPKVYGKDKDNRKRSWYNRFVGGWTSIRCMNYAFKDTMLRYNRINDVLQHLMKTKPDYFCNKISEITEGDVVCYIGYCDGHAESNYLIHYALVEKSAKIMRNILVSSKWGSGWVVNHSIVKHCYNESDRFVVLKSRYIKEVIKNV